jgi:cysteine desulfurase / selenocysteine lyase
MYYMYCQLTIRFSFLLLSVFPDIVCCLDNFITMTIMNALFSAETLNRARSFFPHTSQGKNYLNHASTSPLSAPVVNAMMRYLHNRSEGELETYFTDIKMVNDCRTLVARLINAESPERIAFQMNTSDAINVIASGIPWSPGDAVLLNNIEFPANIYPYLNLKRLGVELDTIEAVEGRITPEMVESHLRPRTRLVALSAVQYLSGHRADLESIGAMCRKRRIVFAVDAIQAVGAVRLDVQRMHIDALAAGAQKWQMGPHGSGFLYVTQELQATIAQANLGWLSVEDPWSFYKYDQPLAPSARRYEGGSLNMPSLHGYHAALTMLLEFGPDAIEGHILGITGILRKGLAGINGLEIVTSFPDAERAGIVTVRLPGGVDSKEVFHRISHQNVFIALREGQLRYSPHFYNSTDEMRQAVEVTRDCLAQMKV